MYKRFGIENDYHITSNNLQTQPFHDRRFKILILFSKMKSHLIGLSI